MPKKTIRSYKDLEIWQLAVELIIKVYKLLKTFPKEEKYGLISQAKDAVVSIASNIAEAWGRFHFKDRKKFLYNSRGSLFETESHLIISRELGFINQKNVVLYKEILADIQRLGIKINNFINSLSRNYHKSTTNIH